MTAPSQSAPLRHDRQTKIVATLGPASADEGMIRKLFEAGVDVFRLNFSHGSHEDHAARLETIRKIERETGRPIGIVGDMQGPKLRVGRFQNGAIVLTAGMEIRLDLDPALGDETRVNLPHPEVIAALDKGALILMDDGKVRMKIVDKGPDFLIGKVLAGQKLSNNKGFNVPGVILPIPALTEKDRKDLAAALDMGVDWIAQSFVQKPEDVAEAQALIAGRAGLIAKIEKPSALETFDAILEQTDAIMLARGDLGVEIPPEDVPAVQKQIIRKAQQAGKPVIVATQMLESMIESPTPTRAEASDVATAVYDGADAVMLSAETAAGQYPLEAVSIMDRICEHTENDDYYRRDVRTNRLEMETNASDAITAAACQVARTIGAACITTYTTSGSTTLRTVRLRPSVPVLCLSQNRGVVRRMVLSYGVQARHIADEEEITTFAQTVREAIAIARDQGLAKRGDHIVLTAGVPFGTPGSTNVLRIAEVT